jgi:hypothetical protein
MDLGLTAGAGDSPLDVLRELGSVCFDLFEEGYTHEQRTLTTMKKWLTGSTTASGCRARPGIRIGGSAAGRGAESLFDAGGHEAERRMADLVEGPSDVLLISALGSSPLSHIHNSLTS